MSRSHPRASITTAAGVAPSKTASPPSTAFESVVRHLGLAASTMVLFAVSFAAGATDTTTAVDVPVPVEVGPFPRELRDHVDSLIDAGLVGAVVIAAVEPAAVFYLGRGMVDPGAGAPGTARVGSRAVLRPQAQTRTK